MSCEFLFFIDGVLASPIVSLLAGSHQRRVHRVFYTWECHICSSSLRLVSWNKGVQKQQSRRSQMLTHICMTEEKIPLSGCPDNRSCTIRSVMCLTENPHKDLSHILKHISVFSFNMAMSLSPQMKMSILFLKASSVHRDF